MSTLTAYSASAGSGKTFRITREYLKLILHKQKSERAYRHVLAVTFTNKATEEMKTRILLEINKLANGDGRELDALCEEFAGEGLQITPAELQQRALQVRGYLLHDYARFSVLTIDKFFQKVLQAFVRDAGLQPGFDVELDTARLLDEAADAVLENADQDPQRRKWLWQLVEQRLEGGKSWNAKTSLTKLGNELFGENFQQLSKELQQRLGDKDFLHTYLQTMQQKIAAVDKPMQHLALQAKQYMQQHGLKDDDFKGKGRGFIAHFTKIARGDYDPTATTLNAVDTPELWTAKTTANANAQDAFAALNPLLKEACQLWEEHQRDYNTATLILKNFMQMGLLADLAQQVQTLIQDNNILPISDATRLIAGLIGESEAPFIYEKMGAIYHSLMIDEFQDTSRGQWKNFLPLIKNSLSEGHFSMVVGDVKQSIYRWRNGDWRILALGIDRDLEHFGTINRQSLQDNWRSLPNVVHFNNALFAQLTPCLRQTLDSSLSPDLPPQQRESLLGMPAIAYSDVAQTPRRTSANQGFVRLQFVEESDDQTARQQTLASLPELITGLYGKGYRAADIAVLVRDKKDGQAVVNTLMEHKNLNPGSPHCFDVISPDTLQLNASWLVRLCVALLRMSTGQDNALNEAFLRYRMFALRNKNSAASGDLHQLFSTRLPEEEKTFLRALTLCSLPEAFEQIVLRYELFKMEEELPFLQALFDLIIQFSNRKISDISAFLQWWDERGASQNLPCAEGQNAITVSTIHKSKGLQYKVVIVPFADWSLGTKTSSTIWMHNNIAPFSDIAQLPLPYEKVMQHTIFEQQYDAEKVHAHVDSLNLLYVALTRAEEQLYIFAPAANPTKASPGVATKISQLLQQIFNQDAAALLPFAAAQGRCVSETCFEFGSATEQNLQQAVPASTSQIVWDNYPTNAFTPRLRVYRNAELMQEVGSTEV